MYTFGLGGAADAGREKIEVASSAMTAVNNFDFMLSLPTSRSDSNGEQS